MEINGWAVTHIIPQVPRLTPEMKAANRDRLLAAAADEFARLGLAGANINEISLAAGLAKGTVYNHFPSKEALFLAVVEQACQLAAQGAEDLDPEASTRERLRAVLASDVAWAREHEAFARVLVREVITADPRFYPRVIEAAAPFIERVRSMLADGVSRGEIRPEPPPDELALLFVGLGDLALVQHWGSDGAWPKLDQLPELVVDVFLDGAAPRGARKRGR
jgi:TetR/AcrR family transcriptional regulator